MPYRDSVLPNWSLRLISELDAADWRAESVATDSILSKGKLLSRVEDRWCSLMLEDTKTVGRDAYRGNPTWRTNSANRGSERIASSAKLLFKDSSSQSCS